MSGRDALLFTLSLLAVGLAAWALLIVGYIGAIVWERRRMQRRGEDVR